MNAYLTFVRSIDNDLHMLGIKNPTNISDIHKFNLISGQPILCVLSGNQIECLYIISRTGNIFQVYGEQDHLFALDFLTDMSSMNVKKYNGIGYYLQLIFNTLSIKEFDFFKSKLEKLENDIFYHHLHTDLEISKIKSILIKEINKLDIEVSLKRRFLLALKNSRLPTRKMLRRKVDMDLSNYSIYINTFVS
jgi:hypothetical protein